MTLDFERDVQFGASGEPVNGSVALVNLDDQLAVLVKADLGRPYPVSFDAEPCVVALAPKIQIEPDTAVSTSARIPEEALGASASGIDHGSASVSSTARASTFRSTRVLESGMPQSTLAVRAAQLAIAIAQRFSCVEAGGSAERSVV